MAGENLTLVNAMLRKMDWDEARQKTLAQNIANADTPGYRPQDIAPIDFKSLLESSTSRISLGGGGMAVTNPAHMSSGHASASAAKASDQKHPYETSPSGNAVVLEEQLLKMNENMTDHQFITNLYQKNIDMLKESTK